MTADQLLREIKGCLQAIYGERFQGLVLFGSEARGDAQPDSDIDLLCLLDRIEPGESRKIIHETYDLQLDFLDHSDRMFSIIPVAAADYRKNYPLYIEARKEGIAV